MDPKSSAYESETFGRLPRGNRYILPDFLNFGRHTEDTGHNELVFRARRGPHASQFRNIFLMSLGILVSCREWLFSVKV